MHNYDGNYDDQAAKGSEGEKISMLISFSSFSLLLLQQDSINDKNVK